ncbi:glycosyltransferase family 2 protein [Proteus vulgaris]|uniref:glycosyltransferase family 2 protein n=1 Tax=Proteus vulgaris TaxID=585 RepID=UPI002876C543|nr:glycosyltransferase family 2 protein [Proteus vulgaris]MDS0788086.1 glycosyltransferase family 2 protein [Proteus vulgaris]
MYKKISIIMSVYNAEDYILESLQSLEDQTIKIYELIIANDGSTDNTDLLIKKFIKKSTINITYVSQENIGLTKTLNKLIELANGDFIARMDADDISLPTRLQDSLAFMEANNLDMLSTKAIRFNENAENIDKKPAINSNLTFVKLPFLKFGNPFIHGTFFFRKNVLKKIKYNESYKTAQDYELLCNLIKEGYKIGFLNKALYKLRINKNSLGRNPNSSQNENAKKIAINYFNTDKYLIIKKGKFSRLYLSIIKRIMYVR